MMSSDSNLNAAGIIQEVFELLDEQYLYQFIDKRIEQATADFKFEQRDTMTHDVFIHTIGDYLHHIYKTGFWIRQIMSIAQARAEAMALLEKYYPSPHSCGYETAFLDVLNSKLYGIEFILTEIAEIIKAATRKKHIKWVYFSRIIPLDWSVRCQIAEILTKRWAPFLPPNLSQCFPAQLADHLPDLINALRFLNDAVQKRLNADFDLNSI
jgi:hypothetical protein